MGKILENYLRENKNNLENSHGIKIALMDDELIINGSKIELIELADYITSVALSKEKNDHLHLDKLTLINSESQVESLIIEKIN